jgi:hypothetical protein
MKNNYEIRGDHIVIFLSKRDGSIHETSVSLSDLERLHDFPNTWCVAWNPYTKSYYVKGKLRNKIIYLHRWLLNPPKNMVIDHINHSTLDNRRENLRVVTNSQNQFNRSGLNEQNSSGYRNVGWYKPYQKWRVVVKVDKKQIFGGYFDDIEEANQVAIQLREELNPV